MKPGKCDRRHRILISGVELRALKSLAMPESFGLEGRIQRYQGKRPIGLYRWDWECWLDTLSLEWADRPSIRVCVEETPRRRSPYMIGCEKNMTRRLANYP